MGTIFKIGKNLYFEGWFKLRDANANWAHPVEFPTIFEAYGAAIRSENWRSCTAINTPDYVIKNYLHGNIYAVMGALSKDERKEFWQICRQLEAANDYSEKTAKLVQDANEYLVKLDTL